MSGTILRMSFTGLTEAFFMKSAGWEAVKNARALLAAGKVVSSNWTPPLLKGVVQEGTSSYRAGLGIKGPVDIENLCTCRASREAGLICAHSVALGLHYLLRTQAPPRGCIFGGPRSRRSGAPTPPSRYRPDPGPAPPPTSRSRNPGQNSSALPT